MSQRRAERTDELFPHVWSYRQADRTDEQLYPHARIQLSGDERREEAALTSAAESHMFTRYSSSNFPSNPLRHLGTEQPCTRSGTTMSF
jgi:hypothetical protein